MSDLEIGMLGRTDDPEGAENQLGGTSPAPRFQMPLSVGLYVHVPFCRSKCAYCDFVSTVSDDRWHAPYVEAILFSAAHWASYDLLDDVPTLYFGGGTPTILGDELVRLVRGVRDIVTLREGAEITVETNPDTTDTALIAALTEAGVNRFSLGIQSLDDAVLRVLGRRHTAAQALDAAKVLAGSGRSFSVDLMCGIPGQTDESWRDTMIDALNTGAGHLSVYPLSIEAGTPLCEQIDAGMVSEPDSDSAASMMVAAAEVLRHAGMNRYEVANYARPSEESRHNSSYWTGGAYLGLGAGAASMLPASAFATVADAEGWSRSVGGTRPEVCAEHADDRTVRRTRFTTTTDTTEFMRCPLAMPADVEHLTAEEVAREDVMLGMRLTSGVAAEQVVSAGLAGVLETLEHDGLVELVRAADLTEWWRVTERGWLLGNEVFGRVWQGCE